MLMYIINYCVWTFKPYFKEKKKLICKDSTVLEQVFGWGPKTEFPFFTSSWFISIIS